MHSPLLHIQTSTYTLHLLYEQIYSDSLKPNVGFILILCELIAINYWGAIAIHTLVAVHGKAHYFTRKTEIATHVICTSAPLVIAIVAASTRVMQGNPFVPVAYFRPGEFDAHKGHCVFELHLPHEILTPSHTQHPFYGMFC